MSTTLTTIPESSSVEEELSGSIQWADFGYDGGVVSFVTIQSLLFDEWNLTRGKNPYDVDRDFDIDKVKDVGVYRDDEIYNTGSPACYTVVVPYDFLCRGMIVEYLAKLNEEYGTDFELEGDNE